MSNSKCSVEICDRPAVCKGLCTRHDQRFRKYGDVFADTPIGPKGKSLLTPLVRFERKIHKTNGCWLWTGPDNGHGYATFWNGRNEYVHRFAYENYVGPIPKGMEVDHRCHVTMCVNPAHLRLATRKQQMENRGRREGTGETGVHGVYWVDGRLGVRTVHNGRIIFGGRYDDLAEAEAAAIALRNKLYTHNDIDRVAL